MTIDWEEKLSHLVGDVLAYKLHKGFQHAYKSYRHITRSLERNLTEYLQEEVNLLPSRKALEDFYKDVKQVQDAVNQCEAKLQQLIL